MLAMNVRRALFGRVLAQGAVQHRPVQMRWNTEAAQEKKEGEEEKVEEKVETPEEKDPKDAKIEELQKSVAYALAEADNARKIAAKDVEAARQYALKSFAKELLDVVDNLARALESVKAEKLADNHDLQVLHKGVEMTSHTLLKVLDKNGVQKQKAEAGDDFDPQYHEALYNIPHTEGAKPNTIGQVVKHGFNYKDRVLRPTQCGVIADA